MRPSGELGPDDDVFCIILIDHMNEPLIRVVED
jgi:hypothetical protein